MGDLYALILIVLVFAGIGGYIVTTLLARKPEPNEGGTWRRTQETVAERLGGNRVRVLLVRERNGRETGRLLISEIRSQDPDWNNKYLEAVALADQRLAVLESGEQH